MPADLITFRGLTLTLMIRFIRSMLGVSMRPAPWWGLVLIVLFSFGDGILADDQPVQVDNKSMETFIDGVPAENGVLMEFYAHWCPACQHFAPEYERVARYFNSEPKVTPVIAVARIDCADEV